MTYRSKLMYAIRIARIEGKDQKLMDRLNKLDILIIDDFGMNPIEGQQQNDFEQILDDRYKRKALIATRWTHEPEVGYYEEPYYDDYGYGYDYCGGEQQSGSKGR